MYRSDVIQSKLFPPWRVKSFILSLLRLVNRGARPDCWLIGEGCCVSQPADLKRIRFGICVTAINLHCQYKLELESLISLICARVLCVCFLTCWFLLEVACFLSPSGYNFSFFENHFLLCLQMSYLFFFQWKHVVAYFKEIIYCTYMSSN